MGSGVRLVTPFTFGTALRLPIRSTSFLLFTRAAAVQPHYHVHNRFQPLTTLPRPETQTPPPPSIPPPLPPSRENIYTLPNAITVARILASPVIGYYITAHQYPLALSLLAVAAVSDVVDGQIARRWNMKTHFGTVLDPAADKILMTVLTVSLCDAGLLSFPLAALIIGRDVGLVLGTMVYRYTTLPAPKTWSRYWDVSLPSAEVSPPLISKFNTFLQLVLMWMSLAAPVFGVPAGHVGMEVLRWSVAVTTVASGSVYLFDRTLVRVVR
ncbi:hypothetical protein HDU98_001925 [Podochytrium sp. JEL0797]|nr:hypothetical protein HDU98_001925 [Podochytrium sp. JEL0797]